MNEKTPDLNIVQIVLAICDLTGQYCRHVGVLMTSLFSHTASRVCVTLLHDKTLTEDNRARLEKTADAFGQEVRFADVSEPIARMGGDIGKTAFSRGTLFRLFIPDLPDLRNLSRIIYLDCDIVVNLDIAELWGIDTDDFSLAAVPDAAIIRRNKRRLHGRIRTWVLRYDGQKYFNSGVLLMNLDRIRQSHANMLEEAAAFLRRYRLCADCLDQDFLNAAFRGQILYIDERFNRIEDRRNVENAILHLTGEGGRPWIPHPWEPRDYLYWDYFARSEWRDQLVPVMLEMYAAGEYTHRHVSDCARHLLRRLKKEVVNNGLLRAVRDIMACLMLFRRRMEDNEAGQR